MAAEPGSAGLCPSTEAAFRLGDAARPLGWSTAIADFNVDGAPDAAVADRIAHGAAGYSYRIQFSISGRPSAAVTFDSAHDAIQLRVSDVDADDDLDLVASAVLSKDVVGIWLNDGHGRFTSSDVRAVPAAIGARDVIDSTDPALNPAVFECSPRRTDTPVPALLRAPPAGLSAARCAPCSGARPRSIFRVSALGPRAPPSASRFLVS